MIQNQEFIQEFVDEAKAHLEKVESSLLTKGSLSGDPETINELFRAVHSIKGTAGFFGLKQIVALAHAMENVFGEIRNGRFTITDASEEILLTANDGVKDLVENVLSSEEKDVSSLVNRVNSLLEKKAEGVEEKTDIIRVVDQNKQYFCLNRRTCELLQDGARHGHKIYEVKLHINQDLLSYREGPVKLFNKMETVGMVVDTIIDFSEINSLNDVLETIGNRTKDVYLGILITTVLERELFAEAIGVPLDKISVLQIDPSNSCPTIHDENGVIAATEPIIEELTKDEQKVEPVSAAVELVSAANGKSEATPKQLKMDDSIRVHVSILNDLLDMAGEMVLGRNQLLRTLEHYRKTIPGLAPILQNIDRLTTGVQEKIMMTRMQPMANVFNKFPRIIRDISKSLSKDIELVIEGEDVELDKSMIENLTDPLTHLVRNAADHGIESADLRLKFGKPHCGKIILRAYHEGGYVNIDIIDDGNGIDIEKVKKTAQAKDIVSFSELENLREQDILKLIFKPGFSTAERITDVSGRGVGMDVVKTNIEKMGGSIEIYTSRGIGTTMRLMLPLTLAIIQSLIVTVEGHRFALPQVNLKEIVRIKPGDTVNRIEYLHDAEVLRLRGRLLPIIHLADALGIQRTFINPETGARSPERRKFLGDQRIDEDHHHDPAENYRRANQNSVVRVLVLKISNRMFGIAVDSIIGREETLVKPLPVYLKDCICYSGVTILGDGKTAMILDPEGIIRLTDLKFREEKELAANPEDSNENEMAECQNLLLFNCSGNETFALDLAVVSRIEKINAMDIEKVGDKEYIKFNGNSMRVIRPEDYLPVNRQINHPENYYVIIPKLVSYPIGILIEKVHDNINTRINLNTEGIVTEGLVGSAIHADRLILIVNIYELFEKADPQHYQVHLERNNDHKRVLLVEDTQFFQRIEMKYLAEAGYEATLAQNGKEALEILAANEFDIMVSDIHMPLMNGLELVKKIRDNDSWRDLPAIALTSMADELTKKTVLESGFDYYEWKLNRDSLLKTMTTALAGGRRRQN